MNETGLDQMPETKIIKLHSDPTDFLTCEDELSAEMFESALPIQHSKTYFEDTSIGLSIGVWDSSDMREISALYAFDEFMYLINGSAQIKNAKTGVIERVEEEEAFVIPKGYDCQWIQQGYIRKFFVILDSPLTASTSDEVDGMINVSRHLHNVNDPQSAFSEPLYVNRGNNFCVGILKAEQIDFKHHQPMEHQLLYLLSGQLSIQEDNASQHVFSAGDCFFIPANTICGWKSEMNIELIYVKIITE